MSGNSFGTLYCVTSFGESHGPAYGGVVDGCPPGLALAAADLQQELDRQRRSAVLAPAIDAREFHAGGLDGGNGIVDLIPAHDELGDGERAMARAGFVNEMRGVDVSETERRRAFEIQLQEAVRLAAGRLGQLDAPHEAGGIR